MNQFKNTILRKIIENDKNINDKPNIFKDINKKKIPIYNKLEKTIVKIKDKKQKFI